ncbi:hypothetical protein T265_12392 [Opisthorchis viverrini]|uniref:Uncharacterized protein n=1 Tax=Opisthorchis viverrini TaxID=6198 RepID=A0A074YXX1_OPIVI|nr:hypothetical protein T265_12392 [Opisthorchis viverrini]KER18027.1 hypothetical protein T265_12392 [Opisthorchis viverrini]
MEFAANSSGYLHVYVETLEYAYIDCAHPNTSAARTPILVSKRIYRTLRLSSDPHDHWSPVAVVGAEVALTH